MRQIARIVLHCSGTSPRTTAASICNWHLTGNGWQTPGYHYIIESSGRVVPAVPEERVSNGARGYNANSIHVCYTGGLDSRGKWTDTRTPEQKQAMDRLVADLKRRYPGAKVLGHRDLSPDRNGNGRIEPDEWTKACPCFDAIREYGKKMRPRL